jgi:hypothetical protein
LATGATRRRAIRKSIKVNDPMSVPPNKLRRTTLQRAGGCLLVALTGMAAPFGAVAADAALKTIAMLDFELIDDTGDTTKEQAQNARLIMISRQLRAEFSEKGLYTVLDNAPASGLIAELGNRFALHECNGCDVDIGRALKADRVLTAWVQKVSNLILNINIQIRDVGKDVVVLNKSVDIRGNTDESWSRGIRYMVRSMVEEHQGNR